MPLKQRTSPGLSSNTRIEFSLSAFKRSISEHGYFVRWSKATRCPNRDPNQDDHHVLNCSLCDTTSGYIYYDPQNIRAHITSFGMKQLFMPESRYDVGTAYFTTLPENRLSFWDKVELLSAKARFTQVIKFVPTTTTYKLKYPVLEIIFVETSAGNTIPPASIAVTDEGKIVFSAIPNADFFTISYTYHPVYIMIDLLHQIRDSRMVVSGVDSEVEFPFQAVGRLDFLLQEEGVL